MAFSKPSKKHSSSLGGSRRFIRAVCAAVLVLLLSFIAPRAVGEPAPASPMERDKIVDSLPAKIESVEGHDLRFRRLSTGAGLSQTRAAWVVQDKVGFLWFGTQYGLNRYDGYKSKVFKNEPGHPESLSCVYIRSLFVDHAGTLWVGCDRYLDRFDPVTESFTHFRIDTSVSEELATPIDRIDEDGAGILWLATAKGLYRFDPATRGTKRYVHDDRDPASLADSRINMSLEDRQGRFWIADGHSLQEFDRGSGKVVRRAPIQQEISRFHEDASGLFWLAERDSACGLAIWNPETGAVKCHSLNYTLRGKPSAAAISEILEARDGTMWFGSTGGLFKFDQPHDAFVRYYNDPLNAESLESDSIIFLFQDREGNIWTCFQGTEPNFFSVGPQPFENFTFQRGNLLDPLVTSIYLDRNGILWIGSMGGLNRIDRRTGKNISSERVGNEIMAIREDRQGVLFGGTFHEGLRRLDRATGKTSPYFTGTPNPGFTDAIMSMIYDHANNLWAAMYGGVGRYDPSTGKFIMYTPEHKNAIQYQEIKEDLSGFFWLGGQSGLHRFDPRTGQFKIYDHNPDDASSLSDNRVNSVHFDHQARMWVGTQNGLDLFNPATGAFHNYFEKDGLAGDVVSCIQEDKQGVLWMGTNNGLSSFDPQSQGFRNFSAADGLPGQDLTGWGVCYQSPSGEMFFGGFSGATAFYPSRILNSSFVPRTVLTDFRLFGDPVPIGGDSPLKHSIASTDSITLSHRQNIFSIDFSALSYFNAETNRYRYRMVGLDNSWHEVSSDRRTASFTTLPVGNYTFEVQGATSRGSWDQPGAILHIEILPAWYQTIWFRALCVIAFAGVLWAIFAFRMQQLHTQFHAALDARVDERTRIARELHDTLLQSFNGVLLRFQAVSNLLPGRPADAKQHLENAIEQAAEAITEGRDAVHELRSGGLAPTELGKAIGNFSRELLDGAANATRPELRVEVAGAPRPLNPMVRDEVYRIAAEALRNAIRYANAREIEVEIRYDEHDLRLRVRDDGKGIDPAILSRDHAFGHWGLRGMRERAKLVGGTFEVWSQLGAGTEIELSIPAASAYPKQGASRRAVLARIWRN